MQDEYLDVVGDGDEVGALLSRAGMSVRAPTGGRPPAIAIARPAWMGQAGAPQGVSLPKEELDTLPFSTVELDSTKQSGFIEAFPQRPFRGERLVLFATYSPAAGSPTSAADYTVIDPAIFVGAVQVGASQGRTPISTFAANAFGVRLSFPHAGQGTRIYLPVTCLVTIAAGDKVIVGGVVIGRAVR